MKVKFLLVVLIQVLALAGMMGYRYYWVSSGGKVVLKPVPVDPRSLFRGDYARLRYEMSAIEFEDVDTSPKFHRNERVYVDLIRNEDGTWGVGEVHKERSSNWPYLQGRVKYYYEHTRKWTVSLRDEEGMLHELKPGWFNMNQGDRAAFCVGTDGQIFSQYDLDQNILPKQWCDSNTNNTVVSGVIEEVDTKDYNQIEVEYGIESYFVEENLGRGIEQKGREGTLLVEVSILENGKATISRLIFNESEAPSSPGS